MRRVIVTGTHPMADALAGALSVSCAVERLDATFESEAEVAGAVGRAVGALGGLDQVVHTWLPESLRVAHRFAELSETAWADGAEAALAGAWWLTRQAIGPLAAGGRGSAVYLVPTVGLSGASGYTMLAAAAEGIRVLAKGVARQWGKVGVTANVVATAPEMWLADDVGERLLHEISLAVPGLGRRGDAADDLAPIVGLLSEPGAHFVSAATIVADGAVWMGL